MPKGGASSLTPVYAGLQEDLDSFLKTFLQYRTKRYADYKQLFGHRGMTQLFNGRNNSAEIIEFNEYLLVYCLPYIEEFVCSGTSRSIEERLFGLYSLYTFFYLQESNHVVKIRVDPDALRSFGRLERLVFEENYYDAYMCCLKLQEDKAFKLVAFIPIYDPSCFKHFHTDNNVTGVSVQTNLNDPLGKLHALLDGNLFKEISVVHREYARLKKAVGFKGAKMADPRAILKALLFKEEKQMLVKNSVDVLINTDFTAKQLNSHGMIRKEIKEKAHSADLKLAKFRRHRSSIPLKIAKESFKYSEDVEKVEIEEEMKDVENTTRITRSMSKNGQETRKTRVSTNKKSVKKEEMTAEVAEDVAPIPDDVPEVHEVFDEPEVAINDELFICDDDKDSELPEFEMDTSEAGNLPMDEPKEPDEPTYYQMVDEVIQKPEKKKEEPALTITEDVKDSDEPEDPEIIEIIEVNIVKTTKTVKYKRRKRDSAPEPELDEFDEVSMTTTPKSIIRTEKKTSSIRNRVSFAQDKTGRVDTQIHEIPARDRKIRQKRQLEEYSDADDESEVGLMSETSEERRRVLKKTKKCDSDGSSGDEDKEPELAEKGSESPSEDSGDRGIGKRMEDFEPEEPASDAVMYTHEATEMFIPLENEAELMAAEHEDGFEISSESDDDMIIDESSSSDL